MTTQVLRGKIEPLALVDVLAYLGRTKETGVLHLVREDIKKSIIINEGTIIFARSNQLEDRLGDILLAQGLIDQEQYDRGTELVYKKGFRHGRALVEIGAISPKVLWQKIHEQIETIACSVIPWENGSFEFIKQAIKQKESITVQTPIMDLITDVIRNLDNRALFKTRFPDGEVIYKKITDPENLDVELEPHEAYLLAFFDGAKTLGDICRNSEFGEVESLRVVYLLMALGLIKVKSGGDLGPDADGDAHPTIAKFNQIFLYLNDYLAHRVGKMGTNLLQKYFEDTRAAHESLFKNVRVLEDGRLSPQTIQSNLESLDLDERAAEIALDDALNEYLNVGILAVKKVLGSDHESFVLDHITSMS